MYLLQGLQFTAKLLWPDKLMCISSTTLHVHLPALRSWCHFSPKKLQCNTAYTVTCASNEEQVESLWVRIKGPAQKGDITVGVYYRPPDQEEEIDETYRQLQTASQPWFSWGTSTTLTSAGKTIQLGRHNPEGSHRA